MELKKDVKGFIHMYEFFKDVLIPGFVLGIWLQGCLKNCDGCMSKGLQKRVPFVDLREKLDSIFDEAVFKGVDGIMISGGEPFLQPDVLAYIINKVEKHNLKSKKALFLHVYTGYEYEHLLGDAVLSSIVAKIDALVVGEYKQEYDDSKPIRGSSNQRIIFPTMREEVVGSYSNFFENSRRMQTTVFNTQLNKFIKIGLS